MQFIPTPLAGGYLIEPRRHDDERGYFARVWCAQTFAEQGLSAALVQVNVGYSPRKGTLRGMHYQRDPAQEVKLVRCTRGAVYDVMVDLRQDSPTCGRWYGAELTPDNGRMLYIPEGFAHGYQTLTADAEISYQTSRPYAPDCATGVAYDDPAFGIDWPLPVSMISEQDRNWPAFALQPETESKR